MTFNIYFGTIGKSLGVKYRFTKNCNRGMQEAIRIAKSAATSFYYKNEGRYGLPSFEDISKESKITGRSIESLYDEPIEDMCRWYAIPTDLDTIPSYKLHW